MAILKVTLVQPNVYWENFQANLNELEEKLSQVETGNLIVLPEMFNTGFSMSVEKLGEPMNFTTFKWLHQQAEKHQAAVIGSFIVKESGKYFNRAVWVFPDGDYGYYDKSKPFTMMGEDKVISPGGKREIFEWKGWKIKPLICYDLRFPELARNSYSDDTFAYDLLIYMGNWPSARIHAWDTLIKARAMENSSYLVAVNRVGDDGNGIPFNGHSTVLDPRGDHLIEPTEEESIKTVAIDLEALNDYRKKFQVHLDW